MNREQTSEIPKESSRIKLSIIIPTLNEAESIQTTLKALQHSRSNQTEIIISDGGSTDNTIQLAEPLCDRIINSDKGRSIQMNTGAECARGNILCFLHADTLAPENISKIIHQALQSKYLWGRFNLKLDGTQWMFRIIERMINLRSCITGVASGDQGIFVYREIFNRLNGFKNIPLMEDIELSKRLKKITRPACIKTEQLITSSRRWEKHGIFKTILLMWKLRLLFFLGAPPKSLSLSYQDHDK